MVAKRIPKISTTTGKSAEVVTGSSTRVHRRAGVSLSLVNTVLEPRQVLTEAPVTINAVQAHQEILRGFSFHEFEAFQAHSQLPPELVRQMVQLPTRTYQRRKLEGRLSSTESDRLWRLVRLFAQAQELFEGDTAAAAAWLQQPAPALGGLTPSGMAETEVGAREVENLIGRLEHGVFS